MSGTRKFVPVIILLVLGLVWGSSFILMKKGLEYFSSVQVAAYRIFIAGVSLLPVVIRKLGKEPLSRWKNFLVLGLVGNAIPAFLFTAAQTKINSSTAGALNVLTPLFTMLIGILVFKNHLTIRKSIGVVLGLVGALLLIFLNSKGNLDPNFAYGFLIVLATICYGLNVNLIKSKFQGVNSFTMAAIPLFFVAIPCGFILYHTEFTRVFQSTPGAIEGLGYISILGVIGTAGSLVIFNRLIQLTNAVFASMVTYLIPMVALFWGVIDGEVLGVSHYIGMGIILIGIYLVTRSGKQKNKLEATQNPKEVSGIRATS